MSKNSLDPCKLSLEVFHTRYYEKKQATMFFSLVIKLFFKILCFQQVLRSWKKAPIGSTKSVKLTCGPLCYISWALAQSIIRRKLGQKLLSSWKSYFLKCLFLSTREVLKNWSYYFHSNCQKTFWTLIKFFLRFLILDNTGKTV